MSDPTVESIAKAMRATSHYRLPLDLFCETLLKEVEITRAVVREILAVMDNEERTPEEMLLLERANNIVNR